jgi:hypothetical protein
VQTTPEIYEIPLAVKQITKNNEDIHYAFLVSR